MKHDSSCNIEIWCPWAEMSTFRLCPHFDNSPLGHQICWTHDRASCASCRSESESFMKQCQLLLSHQVFSILANVVPLRTCKAVLAFHYHPHHYQLFAMPERRTADKPVPTASVISANWQNCRYISYEYEKELQISVILVQWIFGASGY